MGDSFIALSGRHPPFHLHNVKDSAIKGAGIGNHLNRGHTKFPLNC